MSRIAENILTLGILGTFFWIIYQHIKGNNVLEDIKNRLGGKMGGGNNEFGRNNG